MRKAAVSAVFMLSVALLFAAPFRASAQAPNPFTVLDISERTYQDGPAVAVILSQPLDPTKRYDEFLRVSDTKAMLKSVWVLSDDQRILYFTDVEPETVYSITVMPELPSASGENLPRRFFKTLTTRAITPGVNFASDGLILPTKLSKGLPVAAVNVKEVEVEFFRLNDKGVRSYVEWERTTRRHDYDEIATVREFGEFVYSGRFNLDPPKNKRIVRHIPIMDIPQLQAPGIYFAVLRRPGEYGYDYQSTFFIVTDVGLHARVYGNQALILASSLRTGQALADVKLSFYDKEIKEVFRGLTDKDGRFVFPESIVDRKIAFVRAELEGQTAILNLEVPALDLSEFPLYGRSQQPREFFAYSPRDLYRPGETVTVSGLLRDYDGRPVTALPLQAILYRPDGRKVRTFTWHPEKLEGEGLNYYQTALEIPGDAQTGAWRLELRDEPKKGPMHVFRFSVEDFMPERMKLELNSELEVLGPDLWTVDVEGSYLYGAPADGNTLDGLVRVRAERALFDTLQGFEFGDVTEENYSDSWEIEEMELDADGKAALEVTNKWKELKSPMVVSLRASLYESGGRPVSRGIRRVFWPAETLVGIRPLFDVDSVEPGGVGFEVVKVGKDGAQQAAQGLLVTLTKEDRDYYWEYTNERGWEYKYTEKIYTYLNDYVNADGRKPGRFDTNLPNGQYVISITDPVTGLAGSLRFHVGRWWYYDGDRSAARPDKVQLDLDKASYLPGDVIELTVTPPHAGDACILVEGKEPLWFTRMAVTAQGAKVQIPVSAGWDGHDIYLSAVVFRPGEAEEKITPNRAVGVVHLPMDRQYRKFNVEVTAPDHLSPQGPAPLTTRIKLDRQPEGPVFVTLAAVDEGILSITDFKTPDPFGWFFAKRRYAADAYDHYGKVIELMDGDMAKLNCGGDADTEGGGKSPETKVKLVSLFQAPVAFDANGEAEVTLTVPGDFNGKLRLMAVAFGADSFGSAEGNLTVAAPVVAQIAMPRFLSPGDRTVFTLDLRNMSGQERDLNLTLSATYPILLENGTQTLHLKDKERTILRFPVIAQDDFMPSIIQYRVTSEGIDISAEEQLGLRPGYPGIARKVRKILMAGQEFTLDKYLAADLMPASLEAAFKVSPYIPLNVKEAMRGLISYPYGCLEQTTSRAMPLLYATPENTERFDLPFINHDERIKRINDALERISAMQRSQGGFGLWSDGGPEEPWLTVYAADFMLQARDAGINVPSAMLDGALKRLEFYVQRKWPEKPNEGRDRFDFAVRSYAAYVLAKVNQAPLGTLRTLFDNHKDAAGSSLPLVHLGLALRLMGDQGRSNLAILAGITLNRGEEIYWGDYGSGVRDLALASALLIEHQIEHIPFEKILLNLEDLLRDRRYLSTQEQFAVFRLGIALDRLAPKSWTGTLTLAGATRELKQSRPFVVDLDMEKINAGVTFKNTTNRPLYLSAVVGGYTKMPPEKDDSYLELNREFYNLQGRLLDLKEPVKTGDLLLVHLYVNSKASLSDALLVDLLPAGLEIENPNFKYSMKIQDTELDELVIAENSLWEHRNNLSVLYEGYKDDRFVAALRLAAGRDYHLFYLVRAVSPGTFTVPPVFLESMYRPEIRGIGQGGGFLTISDQGVRPGPNADASHPSGTENDG